MVSWPAVDLIWLIWLKSIFFFFSWVLLFTSTSSPFAQMVALNFQTADVAMAVNTAMCDWQKSAKKNTNLGSNSPATADTC